MEQPDVVAGKVIEELRAGLRRAPWTSSSASDEELSPMVADPNLGYLHSHWELSRALEPAVRRIPRGGWRGWVKVAFNRFNLVSLAPYLEQEQELMAHMVRMLDALARRCDNIVATQAAEIDSLRADLVELASWIEDHRADG